MSQRRGLGRGLGALIPTGGVHLPEPEDGPVLVLDRPDGTQHQPEQPPAVAPEVGEPSLDYREIPVDVVVPNPRQPRQVFDDESLAELRHSIEAIGLLQPIVVRPSAGGYELVAGERRLRATRLAGLPTIPALVRHTDNDGMLRDALLENLHRVQLNPLEEAAAYAQLMADFSCTQEELAQRVGRSRPQVANMLRLLKLPPDVQRRVAAGVLSAGHARAILGAGTPERMEALAARVVAEGLSVRTVEELVLLDGDDKTPKPRRRRPRAQTPVEYREAADRLAERLDTRVTIDPGVAKGRITIEFAGVEDLARIIDLLQPEAAS